MIEFWHWLILGVALIAAEMVIPGVFLLWLGVAALVTGGIVYALPDLSWQLQFLAYAVLAVISVFAGWRWVKQRPIESEKPNLNLRAQQYVGRMADLDGPLHNGVGKVRLDDTVWQVTGPELPAGARVRVNGVEGTRLKVEAATESADAPG